MSICYNIFCERLGDHAVNIAQRVSWPTGSQSPQ